jgi:hypothetical protein
VTDGARAYMLLADSVTVAEGRLHVQGGGWNHLYPQELPTSVGRIGIGILLHLPLAAETAEVALRLEGPDGDPVALVAGQDTRPLLSVTATVRPGETPAGSPIGEYVIPMAINLDGVALERDGVHRAVVAIDGADACEAAFAVMTPA